MKRFLVRLFALGILVAAGVIAFAQSQRGSAATPKAGEDPQFDPFQGAESHLVGPADPFAGAPPVKERNRAQVLDEPRRLPPENNYPAARDPFPSTRLISHQQQDDTATDGTRSALRSTPAGNADPFAAARARSSLSTRPAGDVAQDDYDRPVARTADASAGASRYAAPAVADPFERSTPTPAGGNERMPAASDVEPAAEAADRYRDRFQPQAAQPEVAFDADRGQPARDFAPQGMENELRPTPAQPQELEYPAGPQAMTDPQAPLGFGSHGPTDAGAGRVPLHGASRTEPAPFPGSAGEPAVGAGRGPMPIAAGDSAYAPGSTVIEGTGRPGDRALEGAQIPAIQIQKLAPAEVQVGKPAVFEILVRNVGKSTVRNVQVRDFVPKGTQFIGATPPAQVLPQGELLWTLDVLRPDDERVVKMELMPTTEGEIGSVATVTYAAEASARSLATRPELRIDIEAPSQVMIGNDVTFKIRVSNPGTGPATGVVLSEHVPPGLQHAAGGVLEYEVGTLMPNESRELELTLRATKAGQVTNVLHARADGTLRAEGRAQIEVVSPALEVVLSGPKKRYLERQATYTIEVANPGTAPARDVSLVTYIPKGFKFINADNYGEYDPQTGAVYWSLEELPANQRGVVTLNLLPVETGQHMLAVESRAEHDLSARNEQTVTVEGVSAILFQVLDVADPVEVGAETSYEIRVVNQGSKTATHVELMVTLPPELKPLSADGPTQGRIQGNKVFFEPLGALAPRADTTYRVRVRGERPGDLRTEVQLKTAEMELPVTKEESTRVYLDQ